jgi:hypothetical protein
MARPALSVTVFVTGAGAIPDGVRAVVAAWTAQGLVHPSIWVGSGAGPGGTVGSELHGVVVSGGAERTAAVRDFLADQPYGVVRLMALLPFTAEARPDPAAVAVASRLGDKLLQGSLGRGQRLVRMVVLVPDSDDLDVEGDGLLMPAFDANVVVAPEDRSGDHQAAASVAGERFSQHVALAAVTLGGLWRGQETGPFDAHNPHPLGNEPEVVVARSSVRLVEAGFAVDRVTAEVLDPGGRWPVPAGLEAEPAPNPAALTEDAAAEFLDAHAGDLGYQPCSPPPALATGERSGPPPPPWATEPVLRSLENIAERNGGAEADGSSGGDDRETAVRILEALGATPPPASDPGPWPDLRQTCFGLIDGGPLPPGIATRAQAGGRLVVQDPALVAPLCLDGEREPEAASLCGKVAQGIGASLVTARQDLSDALRVMAAGREDPTVVEVEAATRRRWRQWTSAWCVAIVMALATATLGLAVLGLVAIGLGFLQYHRTGAELRRRRWCREDTFAFALLNVEHAARAVVRLTAAHGRLCDWTEIIGRLVHRPWGEVTSVEESSSGDAPSPPLRAVDVVRTEFSAEAVTRLSAVVRRDLTGRGWLTDRYAAVSRRAMEALAARWGLRPDDPLPDPDDELTVRIFGRHLELPRSSLLTWMRSESGVLRRDVESLVGTRCTQDGLTLLSSAGAVPATDASHFLCALSPVDGDEGPAPFISTLWRDEALMNTPSRVASIALWLPEPLAGAVSELPPGMTKLTVHPFRPPTEPGGRFLAGSVRVDLAHPCVPEHLSVFRRAAATPPSLHEPVVLPAAKNGSSSKEY